MTRSILITGSSSGIGHVAAHTLHARGWRVFACVRRDEDLARLETEGLESGLLDVSDADSIEAGLADVLDRTGGTLDALFNNAGFGLPGLVEDLPTDALRATFETNVFGLHHLTRAVIPTMRRQGHGRIVQHSSGFGRHVMKWRGAYNASKHAVEGLTDTLRLEMRGTGIHISTLNTGPVTSKFRLNSIPQFERWIEWEASADPDRYKRELFRHLYEDTGPAPFQREPDAVVKRLIHAIEADAPRPRYHITPAVHFAEALRRTLPQRLLDAIAVRL
ncbi:SDR family NAD(P)-dependent oxidoreductase [Jannaschia sp. CCS1]|uniref:SDR family NAD(P)-dependent oxidoreductase n=1 Tax=Jannaschia sp. (strain CCS1) TaxID=290400 RepID=UPI000053C00F|nr:SDR family NAD(P)-dependent oxidoreductase [Jannaschia sp. CCS1]ABD53468.1 short-chain dehydrogenase/reductase SDR [Jannaschia sp. CCS1]